MTDHDHAPLAGNDTAHHLPQGGWWVRFGILSLACLPIIGIAPERLKMPFVGLSLVFLALCLGALVRSSSRRGQRSGGERRTAAEGAGGRWTAAEGAGGR